MRILLDTSYLYGLMEAQGRFSDEEHTKYDSSMSIRRSFT